MSTTAGVGVSCLLPARRERLVCQARLSERKEDGQDVRKHSTVAFIPLTHCKFCNEDYDFSDEGFGVGLGKGREVYSCKGCHGNAGNWYSADQRSCLVGSAFS